AQAELYVPELVAGALKLGREPLEWRDGLLREPDEATCSIAFVRGERCGSRRRTRGELGDMAMPLALGAELLLLPRVHATGVLDERMHLGEPRLGERRVRCQLAVAALRSLQVAPRSSG